VSKYIKRNNCCCVILKSFTLILKIHIQVSRQVFQSLHPCVPENILWQMQVAHTLCVKCEVHVQSLKDVQSNKHCSMYKNCLSIMIYNQPPTKRFFLDCSECQFIKYSYCDLTHISCSNKHAHNNRGTVGSGALFAVRAKFI
jgi:hypothetical protein